MSIYRDQSGVVKATALSFIILCILILATGAKTEWPQYHIVIIFIYRRAFIIVIYIYVSYALAFNLPWVNLSCPRAMWGAL